MSAILQQPTVSSFVAQHAVPPREAMQQLFPQRDVKIPKATDRDMMAAPPKTPEELEAAYRAGDFGGRRPSDLFLTIFSDVLRTIDEDKNPLVGLVSRPLLGTTGSVRASVVAPTRDIVHYYMAHMMEAKDEIVFSSGFWDNKSCNAQIFRMALVATSRKLAQERPDHRLSVKILWSNGYPANGSLHTQSHVTTEKIPTMLPVEDTPNMDYEIVNYHKPVLGVLHIKYLIIDREKLFLSSNNIHDKANMELSVHMEGGVVNSFYDTFLINWKIEMQTPFPRMNTPSTTDFTHDYSQKPILGRIAEDSTPINLKLPVPMPYTNWKGEEVREPEARNPYIHPEEYLPLFVHSRLAQQPVPMVVVNRAPEGRPGHLHTHNPQDAAWKSAYRNAKRSIFVQTPDFNAKPAMKGVIQACRRGVQVTLWICWGYNAMKENIPFQGGDNVKAMRKLYRQLTEFGDGSEKNLHLYWHVSKGMREPHEETEHCHIKFMSVDDEIAIVGSGNMDVQSWFHSAEVNVMVDSPQCVAEWLHAFRTNQDTEVFGKIDPSLDVSPDQQIINMLKLKK